MTSASPENGPAPAPAAPAPAAPAHQPKLGAIGGGGGGTARELLMVALSRFYGEQEHIRRVLPFINCTSGISLRLIDWFVTNYAKKYNTVLTRPPPLPPLNVFHSYRAQLKAYSKQQFDPFRRRDRVLFHYESDRTVETTIGQLNFFRWMLQNSVLDFVTAHAADIERDMLIAQKTVGDLDNSDDEEEGQVGMSTEDPAKAVTDATAPARVRKRGGVATKGGAAAPEASEAQHAPRPDAHSQAGQGKPRRRTELSLAPRPGCTMTRVHGTHTLMFE